MKYSALKKLGDLLGYTRRERRSSFILLILIAIVTAARYLVPATGKEIEVTEVKWPAEETFPFAEEKNGLHINTGTVTRRETPVNIELNTCDSATLEALPGIGPVLSARIIKYRNLLGGFAAVDQLKEVYGLPEETYRLISGRVKADRSLIRKIKINTADYKQLFRLPYFTREEVSAIIKYREGKGRIAGLEELVENNILTREKGERIGWYLEF
jgi:DNA uptake protein ComE-like DNA-binding protein